MGKNFNYFRRKNCSKKRKREVQSRRLKQQEIIGLSFPVPRHHQLSFFPPFSRRIDRVNDWSFASFFLSPPNCGFLIRKKELAKNQATRTRFDSSSSRVHDWMNNYREVQRSSKRMMAQDDGNRIDWLRGLAVRASWVVGRHSVCLSTRDVTMNWVSLVQKSTQTNSLLFLLPKTQERKIYILIDADSKDGKQSIKGRLWKNVSNGMESHEVHASSKYEIVMIMRSNNESLQPNSGIVIIFRFWLESYFCWVEKLEDAYDVTKSSGWNS